MEVYWRVFKKGKCVKIFVSSFRESEEGVERITSIQFWNCYYIKFVFYEWTDILMQLGILFLDSEIVIFCYRINYLLGFFKQFQDGQFEDSSIRWRRQVGFGVGRVYFRKLSVACYSVICCVVLIWCDLIVVCERR